MHQVEGVKAGGQLVSDGDVGECVGLGGKAGVEISGLGELDQLQRPVCRGRGAVQLGVGKRPATGDRTGPGLPPPHRRPRGGRVDLTADDLPGPAQGLFQEVRRLQEHVGEAEIDRRSGVEHPVLAQWVLDGDGDRTVRADQVR